MEYYSGRMLNLATLTYLQGKGREVSYKAGETIIRRGEKGRALSVIVAGEVEVRLPSAGGGSMTVCRLSAGEPIGEISLLRDSPTTADVVAVGAVTVIEIRRDQLQEVLAECEPLRRDLMARLATNVQRTTVESWQQHERAETFAALAQESDQLDPIVAESPQMRKVVNRIAELARESSPIVIDGEPGSGKRLIAKHIHYQSDRAANPLIMVDCAELSEEAAARLLANLGLGSDGAAKDDEFSAVNLALGGTLVLRHAEELGLGLEHLLAESPSQPDVRLILTCDRGEKSTGESSVDELRRDLPVPVIRVPALRNRRRDIVLLARNFLSEHQREHELQKSAEHALVQLRYRRANVAELKEVVELAARCADDDQVGAEQIFGGLDDGARPEGFDLGDLAVVDQVARHGWLTPLRALTAAGFAAVIAICLWIPLSTSAAVANGFIWGLWEPAVFALFLIAGPIWCTVCPLSTFGRVVKHVYSSKRAPPLWLRRSAPYLAPLGFFVIVWAEVFFGMTSNPPGSAIMLIALVASSVVCCLIYSREVWCAFLCPLGRLASALAPAAPLTIAADRQICTSTCETHDCYRGTPTTPGCTVYHHPQQVLDAQRCKLCLDCLRSCPHGSVTLRLRPPLRGAWRLGASASGLMPFSLSLLLLTPLLLATQGGLGVNAFVVISAVCLGVGIFGAPKFSVALSSPNGDDAETPPRVAAALLVLGWGPLIAYQLGHVPALDTLLLAGHTGSWFDSQLPTGLSVLMLMQIVVIVASAGAAEIVLSRTHRFARSSITGMWRVIQLSLFAYVAISLAIVFME